MPLLCCCNSMTFKDPDISLSLDPSATSVLDGLLLDQSGDPLYKIETADAHTRITPVHSQSQQRSSRRTAANASMTIRWPQRYSMLTTTSGDTTVSAPDALVTVNGETIPSKRLLRRRKLVTDGKSYKWRIDGYKPTFRWKRRGRQYMLLISGNRTPMANLSCDYLTATFRLEVYGTSIPSYHGQDQPGFVSSILLDHIVLTSLLLITPPLEWRRVCGATATRTTAYSDDLEDPAPFVYSASHQPRSANLGNDSCAPVMAMREASHPSYSYRPSVTYPSSSGDSEELELERQYSRSSRASGSTLVQSLVRTVLASISSDQTSLFTATEESSYYGRSLSTQSPPPPYERPPSTRVR